MARKVWGVDSARKVDQVLLSCVLQNFGTPKFWGRYLTDISNVSRGLTKMEISFLKSYHIKVLPIYNVFDQAIGREKAVTAVRNAVFHARRLGIPKETAIFANVESFFSVDSEWLSGWTETMVSAGYRPGFYHDPLNGSFPAAYCEAVKKNPQTAVQSILWSAEPQTGVSTERKAPKFQPALPNCKANTWIWQYGREARACSIDTNLADERVLKYLY